MTPSLVGGPPPRFQRGLFEVGDNSRVTTVDMYGGFDIESIVIYRNASVRQVSIPSITRANTLWVQDNPQLQGSDISERGCVGARHHPGFSWQVASLRFVSAPPYVATRITNVLERIRRAVRNCESTGARRNLVGWQRSMLG